MYMCVYFCVHACKGMPVEFKEQLQEVSSFLRTLYALGIKLKCPDMAASTFTYLVILPAMLFHFYYILLTN